MALNASTGLSMLVQRRALKLLTKFPRFVIFGMSFLSLTLLTTKMKIINYMVFVDQICVKNPLLIAKIENFYVVSQSFNPCPMILDLCIFIISALRRHALWGKRWQSQLVLLCIILRINLFQTIKKKFFPLFFISFDVQQDTTNLAT